MIQNEKKHITGSQVGVFAASTLGFGIVDAVVSGSAYGYGVPIVLFAAAATAAASPTAAKYVVEAVPMIKTLFPEGEPGQPTFWDKMFGRRRVIQETFQEVKPEPVIDAIPEMEALPTVVPTRELAPVADLEPTEESAKPEIEVEEPSLFGKRPERRLVLAKNFQPDANGALATGVAFFGMPGSGKTTTLVSYLEQYIEKFSLPCVIFDSQGDFKSLVEDKFCPRGIIAGPDTMPTMEQVLYYGLQVIVDLAQWHQEDEVGMDFEMAAGMMASTLRELMAAQNAIDPDKRVPCLVGIDEIHTWVPQQAPSYLLPLTAKRLLDAVISMSTTGRKMGVVPFVATQRIAKVNKDVIGGVETRVFGKCDLDNDLKRYREYIPESVAKDEEIRAFARGQMIVCFKGLRLMVRFYNRQTRHTSNTPHVTQALGKFAGRLPAGILEQVARPDPVPMPKEAWREALPVRDPVHEHVMHEHHPTPKNPAAQRVRDREARLRQQGRASSASLPPDLKAAYDAFQSGMSGRKLGEALGWGHDKGCRVYKMLITQGFIAPDGSKIER